VRRIWPDLAFRFAGSTGTAAEYRAGGVTLGRE
jgi:hypothetical protein